MKYLYNVLVQSLWKFFFSFFFVEWCQELTEKKFCFRIYYYLSRQERQQSRYLKTLLWLKWWKGVTYFTLQCFVLGSTIALRGDVIRCTVAFEKEQETDGKIQHPIVFSVNGSRIVSEDKHPSFIEYNESGQTIVSLRFFWKRKQRVGQGIKHLDIFQYILFLLILENTKQSRWHHHHLVSGGGEDFCNPRTAILELFSS